LCKTDRFQGLSPTVVDYNALDGVIVLHGMLGAIEALHQDAEACEAA
jgi:hypothetical protein